MGEFGKIILVILLSSVKFVAGPPFAYLNQSYTFSIQETIIYCIVGGMLGVVVFSYWSKSIFSFINYLQAKIRGTKKKVAVFSDPTVNIDANVKVTYEYVVTTPEKKIFTKRNRSIVKLWKKYGLVGIALLTPVILSIPIGTVLANSLVADKKKIFLYMFISISFWSIVMTFALDFFHAGNINDLFYKINK
jgi:hypothetical protein